MNESDPRAAEVQSLLTRARVAVLRRDRTTLDELLHPEYVCIYPDGRILSREERIQAALESQNQAASLTLHDGGDNLVRLFGDTAVVTEVIRQSITRQGLNAIEEWVATTVLYRQAGQWRIVSAQLTSIRRKAS